MRSRPSAEWVTGALCCGFLLAGNARAGKAPLAVRPYETGERVLERVEARLDELPAGSPEHERLAAAAMSIDLSLIRRLWHSTDSRPAYPAGRGAAGRVAAQQQLAVDALSAAGQPALAAELAGAVGVLDRIAETEERILAVAARHDFTIGPPVDLRAESSFMVHASDPADALSDTLRRRIARSLAVDGSWVHVVFCPTDEDEIVRAAAERVPGVTLIEDNPWRVKTYDTGDPYFHSEGSWGRAYDDQWAVKRVGVSPGTVRSGLGPQPTPVVVAVVDTGLDTSHEDLDADTVWTNAGEEPGNDVDDDRNGYVDDIPGWDFWRDASDPRDYDGHGTFVTGLIAAQQENGTGIAGINPYARIMVLKALDDSGRTRASYLAEAILYAVNNGAQVINISAVGDRLTRAEAKVVAYAHRKGVLVVAAAGNDARDVATQSPAGLPSVLTVAATGPSDEREGFSNWGACIDIAAPGVDVLSLRARHTDLMLDLSGVDYDPGGSFVGGNRRYYRASGTSFAAPLVAGVASLLWSKDPSLSVEEVRRMLLQSARDIDVPGIDQHTGYGLLDAQAALRADPEFFIESRIERVEVAEARGKLVVRVNGTSVADRFRRGWLELGAGKTPSDWKRVAESHRAVRGGVLADIPAEEFAGSGAWTIRLVTEHRDGRRREARFELMLDPG